MEKLAAQFYTLREFCTTEKNVAIACHRVKEMGYDGIQVSGICKMDPHELKNILDGEGLECCVTHIPMNDLENDTQRVIDDHNILGCKFVALGGFFPGPLPKDGWLAFIDRFNAISDKFSGSGISLGYHNHDHEFCRIPDGGFLRPMDLLLKNLNPEIWIEVDTHWVAAGFADPSDFIRRLAGRIPCVHLKDIAMIHHEDGVKERIMCEVGDGTLNWPDILDACRHSMVKWYIVERDIGLMDPFESLQRSIYNLRHCWNL